LVAAANDAGYLVIVVTNQAGIGRGYYQEADFHSLTTWMLEQFSFRGSKIDAVYFCPFHPEYGVGRYKCESEYRKPKPGMLLQAAREHQIDLAASMMIGDKVSDMEAGQRAGVGSLLYFGHEPEIFPGKLIGKLTEVIPLFAPSK
jgi:D-glycero-D-manno-heptose 1,7-bisphosphate phosphatase